MLDDFTPIVHELDGRTIRVWAVADVHIGAKEANVAEFRKLLAKIQADPDSYLVLCGDLLNNGIRSASCPTNIYEEVLTPQGQVDLAAELLAPVADKLLGVVGGNHEARSRKAVDLDPLYAVMCMIRKQELYRKNLAFIRANLAKGNTKDHYALLLVHGASNGKRVKFDQGAVEGVDAIVGGHVHEGHAYKNSRLVLTKSNRVVKKTIVSLTATSWLEYGGYAASSLYMPKATSDPQCLVLEFTNSNARRGQIRVSW